MNEAYGGGEVSLITLFPSKGDGAYLTDGPHQRIYGLYIRFVPLTEHEQHARRGKICLDCILSFQTEDVSEYQLWVLSGKEDGAYPLIGE